MVFEKKMTYGQSPLDTMTLLVFLYETRPLVRKIRVSPSSCFISLSLTDTLFTNPPLALRDNKKLFRVFLLFSLL
jgi:hypothetical protein